MDVMLDLETLGTRPDAAIIQIGAVMFEARDRGRLFNGQGFNRHILLQDGAGTIDHGTLCFWMKEKSAHKMADALEKKAVPLQNALHDLLNWPGTVKEGMTWAQVETIWSNGAAFDQPILAMAFQRLGAPVPWHYRASRCCRTLFNLVGGPPEVDWTGLVPHDALDDSIGQAMQVQQAFGQLRGGR